MLDKKQHTAVVGRLSSQWSRASIKMRLQDPRLNWPLQRLLAMLKDYQAKEKDPLKILMLVASTDEASAIGPVERDRVVSWMAVLNARFGFHPETFFLGAHCLDRFLSSVKSHSRYLECIALTCLYIASKIMEEEEVVPCTAQLIENSDSGCRPKDVFRMERIILTKLNWSIMAPTAFSYLQIFYSLAFTDHLRHDSADVTDTPALQTSFSCLQFDLLTSELQKAISRYNVAIFPSSVISLALLSLGIERLNGDSSGLSTVVKLQEFAEIRTDHLIGCRKALISLHLFNPRFNNTVYLVPKPAWEHSCTKRGHIDAQLPGLSQGVATKRKNQDSSPASLRSDQSKKMHALSSGECSMDTYTSHSSSPASDNCTHKVKGMACKIFCNSADSVLDTPTIHDIGLSTLLVNVNKPTSVSICHTSPCLREHETSQGASGSWMPLPSLQPVDADVAGGRILTSGELSLLHIEQDTNPLEYQRTLATLEHKDDCLWDQHGVNRRLTYAEIVKCGMQHSSFEMKSAENTICLANVSDGNM